MTPKPEAEWWSEEVPHLRIVSDELWAMARARQERLDAARQEKDAGDRTHLSGVHATKRPTYLLSGLIRCGCCGGSMNVGGSNPKRYYCANAREKGQAVCTGIPGIAQEKLEMTVLHGLRHHLMQPASVAEFISRVQAHQVALDGERRDRVARLKSATAQTDKEIDNIMAAIKAGIFTTTTKAELEALEAKKERLAGEMEAAAVEAPALPPDLADIYRAKVESLASSLNAPETRHDATEAIRALIDRIVVQWDCEAKNHTVEIEGELAALLGAGTNENAAAFGITVTGITVTVH